MYYLKEFYAGADKGRNVRNAGHKAKLWVMNRIKKWLG